MRHLLEIGMIFLVSVFVFSVSKKKKFAPMAAGAAACGVFGKSACLCIGSHGIKYEENS